jgi:hypothetical protein
MIMKENFVARMSAVFRFTFENFPRELRAAILAM